MILIIYVAIVVEVYKYGIYLLKKYLKKYLIIVMVLLDYRLNGMIDIS